MSIIESASANGWAGVKKYNIGDEVSQHLASCGAGREFLRQHINGQSPHRLADLGCWTGRNTPVLLDLAMPQSEVYGVDGHWARDAVKKMQQKNATVQVVEATLASLPFPDRHLCGALCWRVLHNITTPGALAETLQEFRRVLCPGSPLVVAIRALPSEMEGVNGVPVLRQAGTREDLYFSRNALEDTFNVAGFNVQHAKAIFEGEEVDGQAVMNRYWAVHLLRE